MKKIKYKKSAVEQAEKSMGYMLHNYLFNFLGLGYDIKMQVYS